MKTSPFQRLLPPALLLAAFLTLSLAVPSPTAGTRLGYHPPRQDRRPRKTAMPTAPAAPPAAPTYSAISAMSVTLANVPGLSAATYPASVTVATTGASGSGYTAALGDYTPCTGANATCNGAPQYTNGTCFVSWDGSANWVIADGPGAPNPPRFNAPGTVGTVPTGAWTIDNAPPPTVTVSYSAGSPATSLNIQRATDAAFTQNVVTFAGVTPSANYTDPSVASSTTYYYRYVEINASGSTPGPSSSVTTPAGADFLLSALPTTLTVSQGTAGATTVTAQSLNHETSAVGFSCPALPAGWSAVFTPQTVNPPDNGAAATVLTIGAPYSAALGAQTITAVATGGDGQTHSISVPVTVTRGNMTIPNTYTGAQSKLGIGREGSYGVPVKAQKLIDRKSGNLDITFSDPDHESLNGITSNIESVPGVSDVKGSVKTTATPEGQSRLLSMLLGDPTVTATAAAAGPPAIGAFNDLVWLDTFTNPQVPHTLTEVKGPSFIVWPGCKAGSMSLSVDKTQNTPGEIDYEIMGLNRLHYAAESLIGTDLAGLDPLPSWGPSQFQVSLAGVISQSAKTASVSLNRGMKERQALNFYRGPVSHYPNMSSGSGTLDLYFDTEQELKRYFGLLDTAALPFGASKTIRVIALAILLQSELNAPSPTGFYNQLEVDLPKISYKKVGEQVNGPDEIMQRIEFKSYHDTVTGSHFKVRLRNSETLAALQTAGAAVAAVPANGVQALVV